MDAERLIQLVQEHEMLFNFNDKRYHDTQRKDIVWRKIGEKLNTTAEECKRQWTTLRDSYRRNYRKKKAKGGTSTTKKWRFEEEMSFILPYLQEKPHKSSLYNSSVDNIDEDNDDESCSFILHNDYGEERTSRFLKNRSTPERADSDRKKMKTTSEETIASDVVLQYLLENKRIERQDEIETLFHSLAQTVKKMDPYFRALAKSKVCAIVGELELENITHKDGTVPYLNSESLISLSTSGHLSANVSTQVPSPP